MLVATIITGAASIKLDEGAGAYVEAFGSSFIASRSARFRISQASGGAHLAVARGNVEQVQTTPRGNYKLRPVGIGATLSVRARATRQIQVQVTDENDRPVTGVPVVFAVGSGAGGSFGGAAAATTVTVTTNAQGIASTTFTAGISPGSTSITASIPGTNLAVTVGVTISVAPVLSATTLTLLAVAGGAAAGTAVVVAKKGDDNEDIQALPPDIRPR
jgi:hypothetical protein